MQGSYTWMGLVLCPDILGRNSEGGCVLWRRGGLFCGFDQTLNPDGASLGCDLGYEVVPSWKLPFCSPWIFLKMLDERNTGANTFCDLVLASVYLHPGKVHRGFKLYSNS